MGADGNVTGRAFLDGGATAEAINGAATTTADLDSAGIRLDDADADINIGQAGNITGLAVLGKLTDGTFTDQIDLIATTVAATATVTGVSTAMVYAALTPMAQQGIRPCSRPAAVRATLRVKRLVGDVWWLPAPAMPVSKVAIPMLQPRPRCNSELAGLRDVDLFGGQAGGQHD